MKIYKKIIYDKDMKVIEEDSYDYNGPVVECKGNPFKAIFKPIAKVFKSIVRGIGKVFSGLVSAITSPFGFDLDAPDFGIGMDQAAEIQGVMLNKQSAIEHIPVVYGTRMVGGTRVFVSTNGSNNKYLFVDMVLAEGECNGYTKLLIDDFVIPMDSYAHGVVASPSSGDFKDRLKVQWFSGTDTQVSPSDGSGVFADIDSSGGASGWTTQHTIAGLCHLACRFEWKEIQSQDDANNNPYGGGIPNIKVVLQGKKIYDATNLYDDSTTYHDTSYSDEPTTFTNNPVSVLLDYMRNDRYGKGLGNEVFDWGSFGTAARLCDQTVAYTSSTTGKAFTSDAVVNTANSILANCKILLMGFRGIMPYQQGKYKLMIEHGGDDTDISATPTNPTTVFSITNDHIVGGISLDGEHKNAKVNRIMVTYVDPGPDGESYQPNQVVFPTEGSAQDVAWLAEDDGKRLEKEIVLPTVTGREQAIQYGEVFTRRSRTSKYIQFGTTLATANTGVGDLINVANTHIGLSGIFRIVEMKIDAGGDIIIGAVEHQPTNYGIQAKVDDITRPTINLPNPLTSVAPVTNLTYTAYTATFSGILGKVTFTPTVDSNIISYRIGVLPDGDVESSTRYFDHPTNTIYQNSSGDLEIYFRAGDFNTNGKHKISVYPVNNAGNRSLPTSVEPTTVYTPAGQVLTSNQQVISSVNLNP